MKSGRTSSRSKSGDGAKHVGAAGATPKGPESWEEYSHPQFRRGRPDLLADIRRKKDGGRMKRKRGATTAKGRKKDIGLFRFLAGTERELFIHSAYYVQ